MKYIGLQTQINRNNTRSILLLLAFPALILIGVYAYCVFVFQPNWQEVNDRFVLYIPFVAAGVLVWFLIAFTFHSQLIQLATSSEPLSRKENMRVYNLTENLCMSVGMKMPKLYVIHSPALNAFASGINEKTFAVTLTTGIIEQLDDQELEGVIAHELSHIRNKDVRLLIVTIIFVGIFSFVVDMLFRSILYGGHRRRNDKDSGGAGIAIMLLIAVVVYLLSLIFKFALSRKREYLADAGAAQMTRNPHALASALRKISGHSDLETKSDDVKQMFIDNGESDKGFMASLSGMFATHPPIRKRIAVLEQM